jgi:GNAT superfamily N-acetyltransferase
MSLNTIPTSVLVVSAGELDALIDDLARAFADTVNGGSPLGFMPPISVDVAREYWVSVRPELQSGARLLLVAFHEDAVVGSAQLALSLRANSPHRATVEKVFTSPAMRGQGVGTALMRAAESVGLRNGRTLLQLNTRHGSPAQRWYEALGYHLVGVIPGWTIGPAGERYDHVEMYKALDAG